MQQIGQRGEAGERLHQLSSHLTAIVRDHPEEQPEERFYACTPQLAELLQPSISWHETTLSFVLYNYCRAHRFKTPPKKRGSFWGHTIVGGQEAEQRWPALILAGQLLPIQVHPLGVERATWSELLWGIHAYCDSESTTEALHHSKEPKPSDLNRLAIMRWRARWAEPAWLQPAAISLGVSQAIARDNDVAAGQNQIFGQSAVVNSLIDSVCESGRRWKPQEWDDEGWRTLSRLAKLDEYGTLEGDTPPAEALRQVAQRRAGHHKWTSPKSNSKWPGLSCRVSLAWAPFPEAGEGATLVALHERNDRMTLALVQRG